MHRILVPSTISYIYGIAAAELFRYFPIAVTILSIFLVLLLIYAVIIKQQNERQNYPLLLSIIILSSITGITGFAYMLYESRIPVNDISHYANGEKLTVMGMIDEPAKYSSGRVTAVITAYQIVNEEIKLNISGRVKVTVYDPEVIMDYGDIIRITGRLKAIRGF
ncbi:MAG: DUF4131 domain-containing protein, partial [Nitrospira sp.]|nr:DUF4131 domain-containing protein [Nitrospira sp.]